MELSDIKDRITPLERETFSKNFTFNEDKLTSHATEILENLKKTSPQDSPKSSDEFAARITHVLREGPEGKSGFMRLVHRIIAFFKTLYHADRIKEAAIGACSWNKIPITFDPEAVARGFGAALEEDMKNYRKNNTSLEQYRYHDPKAE